jgi:uncharacterized protein YuzE
MIKHRFLEVTYRQGKPLAAYLYLPRQAGDISCRTQEFEHGLLIDYSADGRAIGIEITSPTRVTLDGVNRALAFVNQEPATALDLLPLAAA